MTDKQLVELSKIPGNEHLKRSINIALSGRHNITVIGNPDNGLEHLRRVFSDTLDEHNGFLFTFISPCPCGNFQDNLMPCNCSPNTIIEYIKTHEYNQAMRSEIIVRLLTPMFSDYLFKKNIDKTALELLRTAYTKFHFTLSKVNKIISVSETISVMENDSVGMVMAFHMTEAIQYQILIEYKA